MCVATSGSLQNPFYVSYEHANIFTRSVYLHRAGNTDCICNLVYRNQLSLSRIGFLPGSKVLSEDIETTPVHGFGGKGPPLVSYGVLHYEQTRIAILDILMRVIYMSESC
jgi:hypothetical protein